MDTQEYIPTEADKAFVINLLKNNSINCTRMLQRKNIALYNYIDINFTGSKVKAKLYNYAYGLTPNICPICKKETPFLSESKGYQTYCSTNCANKSLDVIEKTKKVYLERYGVDNPRKYKEFKEKAKATNLKKYGVDNPLKNKEIRQKTEDTMMELYGVKNIFNKKDVQLNIKEKMRKYAYNKITTNYMFTSKVEHLFTKDDYVNTKEETKYNFKCKKCGAIFSDHLFNAHIPRCLDCYPLKPFYSVEEKEVVDYIKSIYSGEILENTNNIITPYQLDIYIPEKKLAIEFDGLFWHSDTIKKIKTYHLNKTRMCEEKGIQLIHIFENEWLYKDYIIKNKLKYLLGIHNKKSIYARNCLIKEIDVKTSNSFLNTYHMQGSCNSYVQFGAFYNNTLCAVMSFCKPRTGIGKSNEMENNTFELLRYCVGTENVIGIASKLFKYFIKKYNPSEIYTFADRRYSSINTAFYPQLGFKYLHCSEPNYWYFKDGDYTLYHRYNFRKNVLSSKLKIFDSTLSEWENMLNNGYNRIWDCGSIKYVWKNQPTTVSVVG